VLEVVKSSDKEGDMGFRSSIEGMGDMLDGTVSDVVLVIVAELYIRQWNSFRPLVGRDVVL
jgi:hypothetical protein